MLGIYQEKVLTISSHFIQADTLQYVHLDPYKSVSKGVSHAIITPDESGFAALARSSMCCKSDSNIPSHKLPRL